MEEYRRAVSEPIDFPDPSDHEDPRYYRKYAHTLPPMEAYFLLTPGWDCVNTDADNGAVRQVFDWNNLTEFEID